MVFIPKFHLVVHTVYMAILRLPWLVKDGILFWVNSLYYYKTWIPQLHVRILDSYWCRTVVNETTSSSWTQPTFPVNYSWFHMVEVLQKQFTTRKGIVSSFTTGSWLWHKAKPRNHGKYGNTTVPLVEISLLKPLCFYPSYYSSLQPN